MLPAEPSKLGRELPPHIPLMDPRAKLPRNRVDFVGRDRVGDLCPIVKRGKRTSFVNEAGDLVGATDRCSGRKIEMQANRKTRFSGCSAERRSRRTAVHEKAGARYEAKLVGLKSCAVDSTRLSKIICIYDESDS